MPTVPYGLKDPDILEGIVWTKVVSLFCRLIDKSNKHIKVRDKCLKDCSGNEDPSYGST